MSANPVYYRILLNRDDKLQIACLQDFDEYEYDQAKFLTDDAGQKLRFDDEDEARTWLNATYQRNRIEKEDQLAGVMAEWRSDVGEVIHDDPASSTSKRVEFTFDALSFATLSTMTQEGQYSSMADCVRESLLVNHTFQQLARQGFTEVIVRNPQSGAERVVVIPRLQLVAHG
ncbi:hypothetical protein [Deinococcus sp. QL22]|uniref:hypothetical protein n=1 Tax=Deinococcus sp. QL22 TaxID=2939437 RepID=UPI002016D011|nr:hypothetical protein [Deinococcus sp. QL22]UQN10318.1 hypothetical protein M1R55_29645 [Deinococcus sp. QL22]UQN10452.1 hypothetical protein M1R55_28970 [Deinococcus sp. QL22]